MFCQIVEKFALRCFCDTLKIRSSVVVKSQKHALVPLGSHSQSSLN